MRCAALLFLCSLIATGLFAPPAGAETEFDAAAAASVWGVALSYIAPRALIAASIPQMTIWGLNGLTALDPDLTPSLRGGNLCLYGPNVLILSLPAPAPNDAAGWGNAAAQIAAAAYTASAPLRQAGTQGLISSFFDELFNHFDPYSRYEPPQQAALDQLFITGLAGTGLALGRQGPAVVVTGVAVDSPAAEAGITPGTQITAIDGRPAYPSALAQLNAALNGIQGSTTTLRVIDPDDAVPSDIVLTREFIPPQTVFPADLAHNSPQLIALRISSFNKGTSDNFSAALLAAMDAQPGAKFLLLDLRGNRGGILRQAVLLADSLLPAGTIASAAGRDPDADQRFSAEGADLTGGLKMLVLVDGQTASAAEILAAALADNRRAVVIGSETLGKGLVQTLTPLPDGGELYVTWSRVLAPRGWPLQSLGVMPQICTSLGPAGLASQLAALKSGRNLLAPTIAAARAARAPLPISRILALRDVCPAAIGGSLDDTAATALAASPFAYQAALLPSLTTGH